MHLNFKSFISGQNIKNSHLKEEFFILILRSSIIANVVFLIFALLLKKHPVSLIYYFILLIFYIIIYCLSSRTKKGNLKNAIYAIYCFIQNALLFPALYLTAGGIDSGMPIFFMVGGISTILLLDNLLMVFMLLISGIAFSTAYLIEYHDPAYTQQFTTLGINTYFDIALSVIIVGWGVGFILRTLTTYFDTNQKKANELLSQIEESSTKDPLTGAYNRRFLMDYIEKCIEQTENGKMRAFSIIMFDIDNFKKINDTYGHLAGDDCIKNLAYIFNNSLRNVDIVARYGGEEFVCVLPTAEDLPAFRRAEQIRVSVENTQLSEDIDKKVTISGGVAMYASGMTPEQLINAADENLYIAKESGRNQIVWHNGGIPPLCYVAYGTEVIHPVKNAGRRFTDLSKIQM